MGRRNGTEATQSMALDDDGDDDDGDDNG